MNKIAKLVLLPIVSLSLTACDFFSSNPKEETLTQVAEGELTEEEMEKKFDEAIHYVLDNFGRGDASRPVFVFDGDGAFLSIEGSSNIKFLSLKL